MTDTTQHKTSEVLQDLSRPSSPLEYIRIYLTGFAMGASDIVPGVSGGTMAFILGIYETLINAIKSFNLDGIRLALGFFTGGKPNTDGEDKPSLSSVADHFHLRFLIALGFGLITALLLLSSLLEEWLETEPTMLFAFFAGLIIASIVAIGAKVKWGIGPIISLIIGGVFAYLITNPALGTVGDTFGHSAPVLFFSGMIAICAFILPGVSGSFLLLILGQYDFILGAVDDRDFVSLFFVAAGAGIGLLAFSRVLSWLLDKYEQVTIALLVGFMAGSMRLIFFRATNAVDEETNIATALTLDTNTIAMAIGLSLVGFVIVTVLDHMQSRSNPILSIFDRNNQLATASGD
ncbi:MAG: DUF368 domain-containing protein [Chloroflexota bacterium]